jgi:putative OPT family oligopeptide transporter
LAQTPRTIEPYREITVAAVVLGVVIGLLMTTSFVYISLKLGFGLGGSTVAAILGFAVLRGALKKQSIVENNINQTVASGINIASSGVSFTLPALFLMGLIDVNLSELSLAQILWEAAPFILAAVAGSFMGVVLIIPLRKQMIEFERLRFPSGIAVASLLKSPGAGARQAKLLLAGFAVAAIHTALATHHVLPDMVDLNDTLGIPYFIPVAISLSFANFGAGLLSGRGGLAFAVGGVLAWWIISPIAVSMGWLPDAAMQYEQAVWQDDGTLYNSMIRPLGIGMLIGGALMGVILSLPALKGAIKSLSVAVQARGAATGPSQELSSRVMSIGLGAAVLVLFAAAMIASDAVTLTQGVLIAVVGTLWLGLAGLVVAQATGMTDISPMSGMALIGVTLMFFITAGNIIASVMLGVAVCVGIGQCADMMQDLKTGHMVGSIPKRQQIIQFAVAWIGAPAAVLTVFVLWGGPDGSGGGFGPGTDLTAPQAGALQAILDGLSQGDVSLDKYVAGTALGCALSVFPIGGVGVLVGLAMYLPFYITFGYGIGCLTSMGLQKKFGKRWFGGTLVPVAAGFIVGEALTSLVITLIKLATN